MGVTTTELRKAWSRFECEPGAMTLVDFGADRIRVAPGTAEAWRALESVFEAHGYEVRVDDTDSYCCRQVKGGSGKSLHSYGIALDVNWNTNPFKLTPDNRAVRFSKAATRAARMEDVKHGVADTDMTPEMIDDVLAIRTKADKRVFEWGGSWKDRKDAMHFELDVTPQDLDAGIDWSSVKMAEPEPMVERGVAADDDDERETTVLPPGTAGAPPQQPPPLVPPTTPPVSSGQWQALFEIFLGRLDASMKTGPAASVSSGAGADADGKDALLQRAAEIIAAAKAGAGSGGVVAPASPTGTQPIVLSPIDKALGGEALTGKKTLLSIVAYVVLQMLTIKTGDGASLVDPGSTTYGVMQSLIVGFGGLGLLSKFDRVVQALALIAAKPDAPPAKSA